MVTILSCMLFDSSRTETRRAAKTPNSDSTCSATLDVRRIVSGKACFINGPGKDGPPFGQQIFARHVLDR